MYKLYYDDCFYSNMSSFSNHLKEYYFKLYTDTGLIDENIILNSYEESINLLQKHIFDNIEDFNNTGLLGRNIENSTQNEEVGYFYIKINSYKIKVDFIINKILEEIIIKDIKINT